MIFEIDKQTAVDLNLFEKTKSERSVIALFHFTKSFGGKECIERMFANPLTEICLIEQRADVIRFYMTNTSGFSIDKISLDLIEYYMEQQNPPERILYINSFIHSLKNRLNPDNNYYVLKRGIKSLIELLNEIYRYAKHTDQNLLPEIVKKHKQTIIDILENSSLKIVLEFEHRKKLLPQEFAKLDFCFRKAEKKYIRLLLDIVYEIDALSSVALASINNGLTLPSFVKESNICQIEGLFHPLIDNPIPNDFEISGDKNICFLTGPNMAGKSTFLKSLGISVYLAHLGFPVPAKSMKTSSFNGLLTTINLADNINKGYSHFYSEVLRVKFVAERIHKAGNIFVVFDELFRGTNVKDAYEASLSVISAFARLDKGFFAISTHIIEIADELKLNKSLSFKCFDANLVDETPQYSYKIRNGVSDERLGMYILRKEKVVETIEKKFS